jgi:ATP-dependent RNA helicase RhlE
LHGDLSQPQRERALGLFAAGKNDVLVATDVAARGLDLEHISHVINFDPPGDEKAYVHRVGRTARAGRTGEGITFVTPQQVDDVRVIARLLDLHAEFERAGLRSEKAPPASPRQRHQPRRPQQRQQNRRRSRR